MLRLADNDCREVGVGVEEEGGIDARARYQALLYLGVRAVRDFFLTRLLQDARNPR